MPVLKLLRTTEFAVKHSFHSLEEVIDQKSDFFMRCSDMDFHLKKKKPLDKTIKICANEVFQEYETMKGLGKFESKELLHLITKYLHLTFDGTLLRLAGVVMVYPLGLH